MRPSTRSSAATSAGASPRLSRSRAWSSASSPGCSSPSRLATKDGSVPSCPSRPSRSSDGTTPSVSASSTLSTARSHADVLTTPVTTLRLKVASARMQRFCHPTRRRSRVAVPGRGPVPPVSAGSSEIQPRRISLTVVSMRELLEAGVHFGHQTRRWNPKMRRYIFTERGGIYIIDLQQTLDLVEQAAAFVRNVAERGGSVLFVGTKKQSQDSIAEEATRVGMPYVNHRWLGGLLTNWRTISERLDRMQELRRLRDEGQLELLPPKERITMMNELEKLETNLGGVTDMKR